MTLFMTPVCTQQLCRRETAEKRKELVLMRALKQALLDKKKLDCTFASQWSLNDLQKATFCDVP